MKRKIFLNSILFTLVFFLSILLDNIIKFELFSMLRLNHFGIIILRIFVAYCLYFLILWVFNKPIFLLYKKMFLYLYTAFIIAVLLLRKMTIKLVQYRLLF